MMPLCNSLCHVYISTPKPCVPFAPAAPCCISAFYAKPYAWLTHVSMFAVVYDMNGREAKDVEPVLAAVGDVEQYIFCSSAGVYLKSDQMPHKEEDPTDLKSRHKVFLPQNIHASSNATLCT